MLRRLILLGGTTLMVGAGCAILRTPSPAPRAPASYDVGYPEGISHTGHAVELSHIFEKVAALKDASVAGFVQDLKTSEPQLMAQAAFMYRSGSLQSATFEFPRAIVYGGDGRFIFSFNGQGKGANAIEILAFHAETQKFELREIVFKKDGEPNADQREDIEIETDRYLISKADPTRCTTCHGIVSTHPLFDHYPHWPGAYFSYLSVSENSLLGKDGFIHEIQSYAESVAQLDAPPQEPGQPRPIPKPLTLQDIFSPYVETSELVDFRRNVEREQWALFAPKLKSDPRYSSLSKMQVNTAAGHNLPLDFVLNFYNAHRVANLIVSSKNFSKILPRVFAALSCSDLHRELAEKIPAYAELRTATFHKIFDKEVMTIEDEIKNLGVNNVVILRTKGALGDGHQFGYEAQKMTAVQTQALKQTEADGYGQMSIFRWLEREAPDLLVHEWSISTYEGNYQMREPYLRTFPTIRTALTAELASRGIAVMEPNCSKAAALFEANK